MFELLGIDYLLGLVPQWVPWVIIGIAILLFILIQFFQYLIPVVYRTLTVIAVELIAIVLFGLGFYVDGRQDVIVNAKHEIEQKVEEQKGITEQVRADLLGKLDTEKNKHDTIIKYVPKIITKEDDSKCVIPQSFISLHNYAAKDSIPEATVRAQGASTGLGYATGK